MNKAIFRKKWSYGNSKKSKVPLGDQDWMDWLAFISIIADNLPENGTIYSDWEGDDLIGFSVEIVDSQGKPLPSYLSSGHEIGDAEKAAKLAPVEDWRIENHQELIPIMRGVMSFIHRKDQEILEVKKGIEKAIKGIKGI